MFDADFLLSLLMIIAIDIVLGGDNAVVIALASRKLPDEQKMKAIFWGTALAIVVRVLITVAAAYLLKIPYLFLAGGLLLIWISYKLLVDEEEEKDIKPGENLLQAIRTIVVADVLMGLDNVLAVAGAAKGDLFLIILGLLISIPIMIWGSRLILKAMERFPWIVFAGAGILALTAAKMVTHEKALQPFIKALDPTMANFLTYGFDALVVILVIVAGYFTRKAKQNKAEQIAASEPVSEEESSSQQDEEPKEHVGC